MSTISVTILLAAIAQVESGGNDAAIGKAGERSRFQMGESVWRQHAKPDEPHVLATSDPALAEHVATEHMVWLYRQLYSAGVPITAETLASAWHHGATGAIKRILHGEPPDDYAQRVANLYADALAHQPNNVPAHLSGVLPPPPKPDSP